MTKAVSVSPRRRRESYWRGLGLSVAGVDEVGRGAWAGPLVAAAVICPPRLRVAHVRDSKLLTSGRRQLVAAALQRRASAIGLGLVEVTELNEHGLSWAMVAAGKRAVTSLSVTPDKVLLDGRHNYLADDFDCETMVAGDRREFCIAAASIIAKVRRDALMIELARRHPQYGFDRHKGYGTAAHRIALREHGSCPAHRVSWRPIQAFG